MPRAIASCGERKRTGDASTGVSPRGSDRGTRLSCAARSFRSPTPDLFVFVAPPRGSWSFHPKVREIVVFASKAHLGHRPKTSFFVLRMSSNCPTIEAVLIKTPHLDPSRRAGIPGRGRERGTGSAGAPAREGANGRFRLKAGLRTKAQLAKNSGGLWPFWGPPDPLSWPKTTLVFGHPEPVVHGLRMGASLRALHCTPDDYCLQCTLYAPRL